jgi:YVTN family beta-propeller protein
MPSLPHVRGATVAVSLLIAAACSGGSSASKATTTTASSSPATETSTPRHTAPTTALASTDVYAADRPNALSPAVAGDRALVYVPNSKSNTVDVIDPSTYTIVEHFAVGRLPQHVVPSYDLQTLWVANDLGNTLTPIDPRTGTPGTPVPVEDPYNLYFTADGAHAIVVAERLARLDFRDASTMRLTHSLRVPCRGIDHLDFSADGSYLVASCEFSSTLLKVDVAKEEVVGRLDLPAHAKPQDVRLAPSGRVFYVADMSRGGVYTLDGDAFSVTGFVPTGAGAHGLYPSRDSKLMYVTNRDAGTVSLLDVATERVVGVWTIPHGSPDMGGVSADGTVLWVSGRYNAEVYAIDTTSGQLRARIHVGSEPHGLCVFPQPGRYSLGHTGIFR